MKNERRFMRDYSLNEIGKCNSYKNNQEKWYCKRICNKYIVITLCVFVLLFGISFGFYLHRQMAISHSDDAAIVQYANEKVIKTLNYTQEGNIVRLSYEEPLFAPDITLKCSNLSTEEKYIFDYVTRDKHVGYFINASMNIVPDESGKAVLEIHKDDQGVVTVKQTS